MIYLDLEDLLYIADRVLPVVQVRDAGLLEAAVTRPRASAFGAEAYPSLNLKAAALVHSVAANHALVDGNKRLALASLLAFLGLNGRRLEMTNNEAYDFIVAIASGALKDLENIAKVLDEATRPA